MFGLQTGRPLRSLIFHLQMPCFHLRLSVLHSPSSHFQQNQLSSSFGYVVEYRHFPLLGVQSNHDIFVPRNWSSSFSLIRSLSRLNPLGALHINVDAGERSDLGKSCQSIFDIDSSAGQILLGEVLAINRSDSVKSLTSKDLKEMRRREKIGLANKGRVPWNKGRKHSAETRERIKQRTLKALNNPKVRKKMAECPRSHSDRVKEKIGSSLRRVWAKRLKWKHLREKIFHSWAESIAEAAKTGGPDEDVVDWDSYEKIKQELFQQQLHLAEEKGKAELEKIMRAKIEAQAIEQRMEKLARIKLHEGRIKQTEEQAKEKRKLTREKKDSTRRLKLKQRLSKIRQKISINGQVTSQRSAVISRIPAWEKLDLERIKRESIQGEVSFADQIRAAKNKKAEFPTADTLEASSCVHSFSGKP